MQALRAVALVLALSLAAAVPARAVTFNDTDILNFALNLECLEAAFYSYAAYGVGLSDDLMAGGPAPTGGMKATLSPMVQKYAEEIADDEINHVSFLRSALGALAVPCPKMDIGPAFAAAANAAANTTLSPDFSPYSSDVTFLLGAFIFEDVGVTAYLGALPAFQSKALLAAAAAIGNVEAYHAAIVRDQLYMVASNVTGYGLTVSQITGAISTLRDTADGNPANQDQNIVNGTGGLNLVPASANSLAFSRSVAEVLRIVYLTGNATAPGGFFPNGVNGGPAPGATPDLGGSSSAITFSVVAVLAAVVSAVFLM